MVTHDPAIAEHAFRQVTVKDGLIESDVSRPQLGPVDSDYMDGIVPIGAKPRTVKPRSKTVR